MMKLTRSQFRQLILEAVDESMSKINKSKAGKALGAEYLYLLTQPLAVAGANLPIPQIQVPPHRTREEYVEEDELELRRSKGVIPDTDDIETTSFSIPAETDIVAPLAIKDRSTIWK